MEVKLFEVRDVGETFEPVVAVRCDSEDDAERYLLRRSGHLSGVTLVLVAQLAGDRRAYYESVHWSSRPMSVAHDHIQRYWATLESGAVIDGPVYSWRDEEAEAVGKGCSSNASSAAVAIS